MAAVARAFAVLLLPLAVLLLGAPGPANAATPTPTPPAENGYWKNALATRGSSACGDVRFPLCDVHVTSATSEGLSLFAMDPALGRVVQLQFAAGNTLTRIDLPSPISAALPGDRVNGVLLLGPKAFYAVSTTSGDTIPTLFRADRVPTAMRGGWKTLRHIAGPADVGLSAVAIDDTIWVLRSDSTAGFNVDWQPVATENNEQLAPPGPTIKLGNPDRTRPAAGVTATKDAIYVFGGRTSPTDATRIPLANGAPAAPVSVGRLSSARAGATALVHASTVYLVGGNDPGRPTIERAPINRDGTLGRWERYPEPPPGAAILTATFARDHLWIFRADGSIQKSSIGAGAPGRAHVNWKADTHTRTVQWKDPIDIPIDWTYEGPRDLTGVEVSVFGSAVNVSDRHPTPFVGIAPSPTLATLELASPTTDGPTLHLVGSIPDDHRRTQFLATVMIKANGVSLGPLLRFRFVVKRSA